MEATVCCIRLNRGDCPEGSSQGHRMEGNGF
jgi:hypothetical protein